MAFSFVGVEDNITYVTEKLLKLVWSFRPIEETIRDSVQCYLGLVRLIPLSTGLSWIEETIQEAGKPIEDQAS
jgi:hypothetical protein